MAWEMEGKRGRIIGDDPSAGLLSYGLPDLTDPAALGCLLALVREAHGDPLVHPLHHPDPEGPGCWRVWRGRFWVGQHSDEAAALVAALEAAP